jgi:hypothetical protein
MTWSTDHSYAAAKGFRGSRIELAGSTYAARDWIKSQGGKWDKITQTWTIPAPGSNQAMSQLLYAITSRGLQWRPAR